MKHIQKALCGKLPRQCRAALHIIHAKRLRLFIGLLLLLVHVGPAQAMEYELELGLLNRFTLKRNEVERVLRYDLSAQAFETETYLNPTVSDIYYSFLATAGLIVKPTRWLGFGLSLDSGELRPVGRLPAEASIHPTRLPTVIGDLPVQTTENQTEVTSNHQPVGQEAKDTFFVRQLFLQLTAPETNWFTLEAGRMATEIASSLVYNDFGLGLRWIADLELLRDWPVRFSSKVILPTRTWNSGLHSPLVELRVDYVVSFLEAVGITASYFHDGDNNFGQMFIPVLSEAAVRTQSTMNPEVHRELFALGLSSSLGSKANIGWIGLDGTKYFGDLQLSSTILLEVGHLSLDNLFRLIPAARRAPSLPRGDTIEVDTLGVAVDLSARYLLSEKLAVGGFFLYLSGDDNPLLNRNGERGNYSSFLSIVPYLTHTNLFFSGGLNETFSGRQASTSGVNGRGVIGGGSNLEWDITDRMLMGTTVAALFSPAASASNGHFYGVETDFEGSVKINDYLRVSLEYDFMMSGDFFSQQAVVHKVLIGCDLTYEL